MAKWSGEWAETANCKYKGICPPVSRESFLDELQYQNGVVTSLLITKEIVVTTTGNHKGQRNRSCRCLCGELTPFGGLFGRIKILQESSSFEKNCYTRRSLEDYRTAEILEALYVLNP
jgi:hypothetical protein